MIKRRKDGTFAKGSIPMCGFKKGENMGEKHHAWKGGKPRCKCGKLLSRMSAKACHLHSFTEDRIAKIRKGAKKRSGKNHWAWKGRNAGYRAIHNYIVKRYGKADKCSDCGKEDGKIEWANINHKYSRDIAFWKKLCTPCHGKLDKLLNLRKRKKC